MKYPDDYINQIICGDCLEVMKGIPDNSIDTIITDPPYGLEFMGKDWDKFKAGKNIAGGTVTDKSIVFGRMSGKSPSWYQIKDWKPFQDFSYQWATESLRVAKPGATLLCFGGTRTYHRLVCAIEDAGWILKDCIMWLYGSGFPKATDISKQIDKLNGRFYDKGFQDYCNRKRKEKGYSHNEVNKLMGSAITGGGFSSSIMGNKQKNELPTLEMYLKLKPILDLDDRYDELIERIEVEREVIGEKIDPDGKLRSARYVNECKNANAWNLLDTKEKMNRATYITAPVTPEAILWNGWKSHGLKPAYEPILVAMKPNEGSYANNALKWGVAGLNIDGGRIGHNEPLKNTIRTAKRTGTALELNTGKNDKWKEGTVASASQKGRFPANVILDEEAGKMLDEQSRETSQTGKRRNPLKGYHQPEGGEWFGRKNHNGAEYQDKGGASRFFYCAKASKAERDRGCEGLTSKGKCEIDKMGDSKCTMKTGSGNERNVAYKNSHPTVKPLSLMKYLCILSKTPTGGIVLDPFAGSGSTLIACKELKRDYIGIEKDSEYCEIARNRIKAIPELLF